MTNFITPQKSFSFNQPPVLTEKSSTNSLKAGESVVPVELSQPTAMIKTIDGKIKVKSYNQAFITKIKNRLGDIAVGLTNDEIIKCYEERENVEKEDPVLNIKHFRMEDDGRIKVELDWNYSFIRYLAENGITAETEDETIQKYLSLITRNVITNEAEIGYDNNEFNIEPDELDEQARIELEEAARIMADQIEQINAEKKKRRVRKKKVL